MARTLFKSQENDKMLEYEVRIKNIWLIIMHASINKNKQLLIYIIAHGTF